jgi:twitching motility two-component system response regulator PilG
MDASLCTMGPADAVTETDQSSKKFQSPVSMPGERTLRVLLVDDSRSIRQTTETLLQQCGFITAVACDGFEALCCLSEARPDIILMDGMMPRLDGFQTCALIRRHSHYRNLPVIILSGSDSLLDRVRAELAGAQRYLLKPFSRQELVQAIRELIPSEAGEKRAAHSGH